MFQTRKLNCTTSHGWPDNFFTWRWPSANRRIHSAGCRVNVLTMPKIKLYRRPVKQKQRSSVCQIIDYHLADRLKHGCQPRTEMHSGPACWLFVVVRIITFRINSQSDVAGYAAGRRTYYINRINIFKYPSFSSAHFLKFPGSQLYAGTFPASDCSEIHATVGCFILSASTLSFPVLYSMYWTDKNQDSCLICPIEPPDKSILREHTWLNKFEQYAMLLGLLCQRQ